MCKSAIAAPIFPHQHKDKEEQQQMHTVFSKVLEDVYGGHGFRIRGSFRHMNSLLSKATETAIKQKKQELAKQIEEEQMYDGKVSEKLKLKGYSSFFSDFLTMRYKK